MLCGVFPAPAIAVDQSQPDLVLRIHGLVPALKVVDDIAGAAGSQVSPSLLLSRMLQGTAWIDPSKDIVLGAWFDPAKPDAPPVMGAIVPFTSENSGFASAYHAATRKGYYLVPLPPGNPTPLSTPDESALAGESAITSGRFLSMELSLSQVLKNSDPLVEKWAQALEKKMAAASLESSPSITPDQAKKMVSGLVGLGKQIKRMAVGIDLNKSKASFFMTIKGVEGSKLDGLLTKKHITGESRLVNLTLPEKFSIRFFTHPYANKEFVGLLNDNLGDFYKAIGIDMAQAGKIMKYFTGETAGGMTLKNGKALDMAIVAVLDDSVKRKPDFLGSVYIPWLINYTKKIVNASQNPNPGAQYMPHLGFIRTAESKVAGQRVWGVKGWFLGRPAPGKKPEKISISIRMAVMDSLLLAASDDKRLGALIKAAKDLKPGPAIGPLFEVKMRTAGLTGSGTGEDLVKSMSMSGSGELIMTADIKDGELVFEDKMKVADIKALVASAMKNRKPQMPSARVQQPPRAGQKSIPPKKKRKLTPDTAAYWINKGSLYSSYGNDTAAIRSFKKALELDPKAVDAEFKLGVSYGALREFDKALKHINRVIKISPENGRYRYGRAWLYLLSGQRDKAMDDMKTAAAMGNPDAIGYLESHSEMPQ